MFVKLHFKYEVFQRGNNISIHVVGGKALGSFKMVGRKRYVGKLCAENDTCRPDVFV